MSKRRGQSPVIPWIGGTLIWAYMSILSHTLRWRVEGIEHMRTLWDSPQGWVAATWHSRILLMPYVQIRMKPKWPKPPHPAALMVSPSKDGEFTKRAGTWLGLFIIRGSSSGRKDKSKRGVSAARESMEVMKKGGCIVMTIDGPKGPRETVGIGTIKLAQQMGAPILIYGLSANAKRMNTWDRLLWPNPFARGAVAESARRQDWARCRGHVSKNPKERREACLYFIRLSFPHSIFETQLRQIPAEPRM